MTTSSPKGIPTQLGHVALRVRDLNRAVTFLSRRDGADPNRVGMYHMAWEMASFEELEQFHARLIAQQANIVGYCERQSNVMFLDPTAMRSRRSGSQVPKKYSG